MAEATVPFEDVASLLRDSAALRGDSVALVTAEGETMSYTRLLDRVLRLAIDLHAATLTVPRRPRIAIVLPNGQEMAVASLAVCHAGTAVPFNPAYTAAEFERYFAETAVDLVLTLKEGVGPAAVIAEKLGLPVAYLAQGAEGLVGRTDTGAMATAPGPNDLALVLLTSGSTGRSKAVPLTHRNVCCSALEVCKSIELSADDRCLSMWEQYHIGGVVDLLLAPLAAGGTIISTAGFDASQFFSLLQTMRPTWFQGVPTTLNELAGQVERRGLPPGPVSLRLIRSVAAALPPRLMADLERQFGVPVIQTYGMTEASPLITSTGLSPDRRKPGSTGRSCGTSIRIVDAKGANCGVCAEGDIAIAGSNVFTGYENDDEANAAQFRDGWFYTGDKGFLDAEGDLFVTGRTKQLINRGGEKVNPQEVDDALLALPEISEAASFAVKHPTLGEDVAAAVVLREGGTLSAAETRAFLATRLAAFKGPHRILFLDRLPRNPVGKVDRLALSSLAEQSVENDQRGRALPRSELEHYLVRLWERELNVSPIGIDDDFFMLGGDSLSSLRVILALETELDLDILGHAAAQATTVRTLAEQLVTINCAMDLNGVVKMRTASD
ncbi:non-ribosomal peptide synthetase [Bauldia litoralis]|uniref:Acyl-CoA synthetase (AMP-forming)/AMP-acid ligase II n=1 Tax=Bauldia litoralis TaxID=665467 RepID=A0A1G6EM87_9HYPH|nr:non-ribosomal peptide synthetase [Bauldia litoralis]SDB58623.1 Acyl-CoA synthetase (AMP-forming)/AMP-acid ligase II [Bauldia litoralis]